MPSAIAAALLRLACRKSARGASLAAMSICRALASKDEADPRSPSPSLRGRLAAHASAPSVPSVEGSSAPGSGRIFSTTEAAWDRKPAITVHREDARGLEMTVAMPDGRRDGVEMVYGPEGYGRVVR